MKQPLLSILFTEALATGLAAEPLNAFVPGGIWPDNNAARLVSADKLAGPWTGHGNPCVGPADRIATTFQSQSTFVLPMPGKKDAFIFMADRWNPGNAIDVRARKTNAAQTITL